jgi:hypothetical protein
MTAIKTETDQDNLTDHWLKDIFQEGNRDGRNPDLSCDMNMNDQD